MVIAPDSASRYLSKIFDDNWMKENGYMEPDLGSDKVEDLVARRGEVHAVDLSASVGDVVGMMRTHGISQVPVLSSGRVVGMIGEGDLLGALSDGPGALDLPVSERMNSDFSIVEPGNSTGVLGQLLLQNKVVIVEDSGKVVGIITKIDYIEYVARKSH